MARRLQTKGTGAPHMRHRATFACRAGHNELIADVQPENLAMLKVFETSGLEIRTRRKAGVIHTVLQLS
jgi:hypothetical protein